MLQSITTTTAYRHRLKSSNEQKFAAYFGCLSLGPVIVSVIVPISRHWIVSLLPLHRVGSNAPQDDGQNLWRSPDTRWKLTARPRTDH